MPRRLPQASPAPAGVATTARAQRTTGPRWSSPATGRSRWLRGNARYSTPRRLPARMPPPALRVRRHRTWSPAVAAGKGPAARAHRARARVCACSAAGEPLPDPVAEVADFLRAHRMAHRILMPVEREAEPAQDFRDALEIGRAHV